MIVAGAFALDINSYKMTELTSSLICRPATIADTEAIFKLSKSAHSGSLTYLDIRNLIVDSVETIVCADDKGIRGFATFYDQPENGLKEQSWSTKSFRKFEVYETAINATNAVWLNTFITDSKSSIETDLLEIISVTFSLHSYIKFILTSLKTETIRFKPLKSGIILNNEKIEEDYFICARDDFEAGIAVRLGKIEDFDDICKIVKANTLVGAKSINQNQFAKSILTMLGSDQTDGKSNSSSSICLVGEDDSSRGIACLRANAITRNQIQNLQEKYDISSVADISDSNGCIDQFNAFVVSVFCIKQGMSINIAVNYIHYVLTILLLFFLFRV